MHTTTDAPTMTFETYGNARVWVKVQATSAYVRVAALPGHRRWQRPTAADLRAIVDLALEGTGKRRTGTPKRVDTNRSNYPLAAS